MASVLHTLCSSLMPHHPEMGFNISLKPKQPRTEYHDRVVSTKWHCHEACYLPQFRNQTGAPREPVVIRYHSIRTKSSKSLQTR